MLTDEKEHIRQLGLRRILKCRSSQNEIIREFRIPILNFKASSYLDLIDWQSTKITEPPLTRHISTETLKKIISKEYDDIEFLNYPCHTQAVERCVKLVTEASNSVCGPEAREGFILSRITSRECLPKMDSKRQFSEALQK